MAQLHGPVTLEEYRQAVYVADLYQSRSQVDLLICQIPQFININHGVVLQVESQFFHMNNELIKMAAFLVGIAYLDNIQNLNNLERIDLGLEFQDIKKYGNKIPPETLKMFAEHCINNPNFQGRFDLMATQISNFLGISFLLIEPDTVYPTIDNPAIKPKIGISLNTYKDNAAFKNIFIWFSDLPKANLNFNQTCQDCRMTTMNIDKFVCGHQFCKVCMQTSIIKESPLIVSAQSDPQGIRGFKCSQCSYILDIMDLFNIFGQKRIEQRIRESTIRDMQAPFIGGSKKCAVCQGQNAIDIHPPSNHFVCASCLERHWPIIHQAQGNPLDNLRLRIQNSGMQCPIIGCDMAVAINHNIRTIIDKIGVGMSIAVHSANERDNLSNTFEELKISPHEEYKISYHEEQKNHRSLVEEGKKNKWKKDQGIKCNICGESEKQKLVLKNKMICCVEPLDSCETYCYNCIYNQLKYIGKGDFQHYNCPRKFKQEVVDKFLGEYQVAFKLERRPEFQIKCDYQHCKNEYNELDELFYLDCPQRHIIHRYHMQEFFKNYTNTRQTNLNMKDSLRNCLVCNEKLDDQILKQFLCETDFSIIYGKNAESVLPILEDEYEYKYSCPKCSTINSTIAHPISEKLTKVPCPKGDQCRLCSKDYHPGKTCDVQDRRKLVQLMRQNCQMIPCPLCLSFSILDPKGIDFKESQEQLGLTEDDIPTKVKCGNCEQFLCYQCLAPWDPIKIHGPMYHRSNCKMFIIFPTLYPLQCPLKVTDAKNACKVIQSQNRGHNMEQTYCEIPYDLNYLNDLEVENWPRFAKNLS